MADIRAEYLIIQNRAGLVDRSARGRLRFEGADAGSFLQGLLTNDVAATAPGEGVYAALLIPQGRMVADFRIYNQGGTFFADVAPGMAPELAAHFDSLVFAEDLQVSDVTPETAQVSVVGTRAPGVLAAVLDIDEGSVSALKPLAQMPAGRAFLIRADLTDVPMFDVWLPAGERDALVRRLTDAGAVAVSDALLDVLRIEAARPAFGIDMTTETIPLEAGLLERAISTTKGCYVGQEVIIRVLHRGAGRVAKRLVQIVFDAPDARVASGQAVRAAEAAASTGGHARDVGRITSSAFSPGIGRTLALAYVARELAEPGARVAVDTPSGVVAGEIVKLAG